MTKILFVDDKDLNRITAKAMLMHLCEEYLIVGSAMEAIESMQSFEPDIILMDISMPEIDGLEGARRIRNLRLAKRPFIVGVSGFIDEMTQGAAREVGMDAFLEKPFTRQELIAILAKCEGFAVSA